MRTVLDSQHVQKVSAHALTREGQHVGNLVTAYGATQWTATLWTFQGWPIGEPTVFTDRDLYNGQAALAVVRASLGLPAGWEADDETRGMEWRDILRRAGIEPMWVIS